MTPGSLEALRARISEDNKKSGLPAFEFKSIPQGAATSVWAGVVAAAEDVGAKYCEDCHVADIVDGDATLRGGVRPYALNPDRAKALWAKSEEMVGERF
jgi:hypothetical protein